MALNIPMPGVPGMSFGQGMDAGSAMMSRIMQPILERERQKQMADRFQQEMAFRKQQAARSGQNDDLQRAMMQEQLTGLKHKNDPAWEWEQLNKIGGDKSSGLDMSAIAKNPMLRAFIKHKTGMDPLAETPEQRRQADFQSKVEFENLKTDNKARALRDKDRLAVEKDLPSLQKSLSGVDELLNIAKTNPDIFGHAYMPDLYAKTSKNKNFGRWQNLVSDAIAGLEQKLSSKGNIVALKMAAQLKPSHAEKQEVAIGKLESMRKQLQDSINHSNDILGKGTNDISGHFKNLSNAELLKIMGGNKTA